MASFSEDTKYCFGSKYLGVRDRRDSTETVAIAQSMVSIHFYTSNKKLKKNYLIMVYTN